MLRLKSRILKYMCSKCVRFDTVDLLQARIDDKEKLIAYQEEIIKNLRTELERLKPQSRNVLPEAATSSYSGAVRKSPERVFIVKPKDKKQSSEVTRQVMEEKIDPSALGVGVSRVKYIREGGVAVTCVGEAQDVQPDLGEQLGQGYEVLKPERKNPRIMVFDVQKSVAEDEDELVKKIVKQNGITTEDSKLMIRVVFKYETKKGKTNVVLELDPSTYSQVNARKSIGIGWRMCRYVDYINIVQCFKCWKFGHMAKECKSEKVVCGKCTGEHKANECQSNKEECVNCKHAATKFNITGVECNHPSYSKKCQSYRRIFLEFQKRFNYPDTFGHNI